MSEGYQRRDREIVDYRLWRAWPEGDAQRGPPPPSLEPGSYFACVGAAQTFDCLVQQPRPALLAAARFVVFQVMSARSADRPRFHSLRALFGEFPQLVDERMLAAVVERADALVECVTSRGTPQELRSAITGVPCAVRAADAGTGEDPAVRWTDNTYYPSPEMHEAAARALTPACRALLARAGRDPAVRSGHPVRP